MKKTAVAEHTVNQDRTIDMYDDYRHPTCATSVTRITTDRDAQGMHVYDVVHDADGHVEIAARSQLDAERAFHHRVVNRLLSALDQRSVYDAALKDTGHALRNDGLVAIEGDIPLSRYLDAAGHAGYSAWVEDVDGQRYLVVGDTPTKRDELRESVREQVVPTFR